jgi:hypothetical protein
MFVKKRDRQRERKKKKREKGKYRGRIRGDHHGLLQPGIQCTIAPVPPLIAVVLWPRAAQPDPLGGPTYCRLHDFVRGLPRG